MSSFLPFKTDPKKRMAILFEMFSKFGDLEIRYVEV